MEDPRDADFAVRVVSQHGGSIDDVVALPGTVNRVFRVSGPRTDWVVRFPVDDQRLNEFPMEVWAARRVRDVGVPTARTVAHGHLDARPYLIIEYVEPYESQDPGQSWRWLGRYAARLSTARLHNAPHDIYSRFGRDLPLAWRAHLSYNLDALTGQDPLLQDGAYEEEDRARLRAAIESLMSVDFTFGLAHGDLAPRNLLHRRPPESPVLLDWGTATTGPAVWTDLQRVYAWARYDRTIPESSLAQFADAAGVPLDDRANAVLEQMSVVRLLDLARWARDQRPDLYEEYLHSSGQALAVILGAR